jgi:LEA14-like dessication related protein
MSRWFKPFLAIVVLAAVGGCVSPQSIQPPTIALQDVKILNSKGFNQNFQIVLLVSNPNDFDIPLTGLKFDMKMNGLDFAEGLSNKRVDIPRLGRAEVPVDVSVKVLALMYQLKAVHRAKGLDYQVAGTVFLDHILLPKFDFDRKGRVNLDIGAAGKRFKAM